MTKKDRDSFKKILDLVEDLTYDQIKDTMDFLGIVPQAMMVKVQWEDGVRRVTGS